MLWDRCLSVLSVLFVTLVYCAHRVGWIEMKLGLEVGLSPSHIVLDGNRHPPPPKGTAPNFRPMSVVAKRSPISATAEHLYSNKVTNLHKSTLHSTPCCPTA